MNISLELALIISESNFLTSTELDVFKSLVFHTNHQNFNCFPKETTIAADINSSVITVKRAIKSLQEKEVIRVSRTKDKQGFNRTNKYGLCLDFDFWYGKLKDNFSKINFYKIKEPALHSGSSINVFTKTRGALKSQDDNNATTESCQFSQGKKIVNNEILSHTEPQATRSEATEQTTGHNNKTTRKVININSRKEKAPAISLEQIKIDFKYDELIKVNSKTRIDIIDSIFDVIHKAINAPGNVIRVSNGNIKPKQYVINRLKKLTTDDLNAVIENIATGAEEIKNMGAYLLTCLVNFVDYASINLRHLVNKDLEQNAVSMNQQEETAEPATAQTADSQQDPVKTADSFPTCEQITDASGKVDYDALLRNMYPSFRAVPTATTA